MTARNRHACNYAKDTQEDRNRRVAGWPTCSDDGTATHAVRGYFFHGPDRNLYLCAAHATFLAAINPFGQPAVKIGR